MGREIRRVPEGWEHPKANQYGRYDYLPLHDRSYEEALAEWEDEKRKWDAGERPDSAKADPEITFTDWHGDAPNADYYRPAWAEESRTHIQIYETVSEGTPVSPVFADNEEAIAWVIENWGRSPEAAREFVEAGWAPSFVINLAPTGARQVSDANAGAFEPEFLGGKKDG